MVRKYVWLVGVLVAVAGIVGAEAPAPPAIDKYIRSGRVLDFEQKLRERVHFATKLPMTIDRVLDEFLTRNDIPYIVNEKAFAKAGYAKDVMQKVQIDPFDMDLVTRATILKRVLNQLPAASDQS